MVSLGFPRVTRSATMLLVAAIVARTLAVLGRPPGFPPQWGGETAAVAWSLAQGLGFGSPYLGHTGPTALMPPIYPLLLGGIFSLGGYAPASGITALVLNVGFSSAAVLPLKALGTRLFGHQIGLIAAWVWALYPLTGSTDAQFVWNTSLFVLLLVSYLAMTVSFSAGSSRWRWVGYAGLTALLVLTDPVSLAAVVPATIWLAMQPIDRGRLALAILLACIPPSAWLARNYARFGEFVFLRAGLGLELSVGIRHDEFKGERLMSLPNRDPEEWNRYASMGEQAYLKKRTTGAFSWIRAHPTDYLLRVGRRVLGFWSGWGLAGEVYVWRGRFVVLKTLLYSTIGLGSLVGLLMMVRERRKGGWLMLAVFLAYPMVYYLTHVMPRYRLPLEPLMFCLATYAFYRVLGRGHGFGIESSASR